ncbi:DUF309 domain-containing protein [Primorskyibacter sp. 2E107]|uniref:DUF309 domain-containing protein n=1 Tax=Primorskyibacter sp. 2E107 TaxID=3403458 RepID=UPI003AF6C569
MSGGHVTAHWRPPHAYVPGQTRRHPEDLFDPLKQIAQPLERSPAFVHGLRMLREGYFWEAHECLEPVWMAAPANSGEKLMVQGVIQLANARLKAVMGKSNAEARLRAEARRLMSEAFARAGAPVLGLTEKDTAQMLQESTANYAK